MGQAFTGPKVSLLPSGLVIVTLNPMRTSLESGETGSHQAMTVTGWFTPTGLGLTDRNAFGVISAFVSGTAAMSVAIVSIRTKAVVVNVFFGFPRIFAVLEVHFSDIFFFLL
jgi:hypothetical protein